MAATLVLGTGGSSGSVIGNIAFCSNASDPWCDTSTNKMLAFNRSDVYTFGGSISGPGQVLQVGSGTTVMSGASTYTGPTNGRCRHVGRHRLDHSHVFVNSGGMLPAAAAVGGATIDAGGLLAPANPGGALTVQGNLLFPRRRLSGPDRFERGRPRQRRRHCDARRQCVGLAAAGSSILKQYTILKAAGGVSGTFAGVANLPANAHRQV